MKLIFIICISISVCNVFAQQTIRPDGIGGWTVEGAPTNNGPCGGMSGASQALCQGMQQDMQIKQVEQQRLLTEQQVENQRLQNELLKERIARERAAAAQQRVQVAESNADFVAWKAANPWYEKDRARTEFANLYGKQLRQERPNLIGRPFFDAVTAKVDETFGKKK
jgi:hypothetical protein